MLTFGKVAEWSIASDLKSDEAKASVSSNLTLSVLNLACDLKVKLANMSDFTDRE
jgi:hypothetical protein